jgi:nucleotide-binding universal stress UspA family protein
MNILATLDGSPESEAILAKIIPLAKASAATVFLLYVVEPPPESPAPAELSVRMLDDLSGASSQGQGVTVSQRPTEPQPGAHESRGQLLARIKNEAEDYLRARAQPLLAAGLAVQTEAILDGHPAESIIHAVSQHAIDIVAMSTHGRSGVSRLIHGSVTGAVISAGAVPVLVFRPGETSPGGASKG